MKRQSRPSTLYSDGSASRTGFLSLLKYWGNARPAMLPDVVGFTLIRRAG